MIVALFLQYGYRRTHVKKGFIDELMGNISSFEKIAQNFRALYQNFEVSPLQWLRPSLENKNSLISERWLTLLKRIIEARRDDATDTQIASFTREFLKILADYRDLIVLPLVERANSAIQVTKGTKIKYAKFRADYNHLVDGTNGLVGRLNSELSLAKNPVKESAERIIEDLEVIET